VYIYTIYISLPPPHMPASLPYYSTSPMRPGAFVRIFRKLFWTQPEGWASAMLDIHWISIQPYIQEVDIQRISPVADIHCISQSDIQVYGYTVDIRYPDCSHHVSLCPARRMD